MEKYRLILSILFFVTSVVHSATVIKNPGLYSSSDKVFSLNGKNFEKRVHSDNKKLWIVEFYMDWCSDCRNFSPIWKKVGESIYEWRCIVVVAAINCANDNNVPVCGDNDVKKYPDSKFFSGNTSENFLDESTSNMKTIQDVDQIIELIVDKLINEQRLGRGHSSWPNLALYRADFNSLLKTASNKTQYGFLIFENSDSRLGAEVILDLHMLETIIIRRATLENPTAIRDVTKNPSVIAIDRNNSQTPLNIFNRTREGMKNAILEFLKSKNVSTEHSVSGKFHSDDEDDDEIQENSEDILYQINSDSALYKVLKNDFSLQKIITGDGIAALRLFLKVIVLYYPVQSPQMKNYLEALKAFAESKNITTGREFQEQVKLKKRELRVPLSEEQIYINCGGYTCGLWSLFHTLTVSAAEYNNPNDTNHLPVLSAMHGFAKHFFGCRACSTHFQEMSAEYNIFKPRTPDEAIIWLWKGHNMVNKRLKKIQYPSAKNCLKCRLSNGEWNENEVLIYLKNKYKSYSIIEKKYI